MIEISIPGFKEYNFKNVVFDYNGTLAVDGKIDIFIRESIVKLSKLVNIYILTADTYGNVEKECKELPVTIKTFPCNEAAFSKKDIVSSLEGESICVGNGYNDIEMFKIADLSICIMGKEGCSGKLLAHSDIVLSSIEDMFNSVFNTSRIKATLRG